MPRKSVDRPLHQPVLCGMEMHEVQRRHGSTMVGDEQQIQRGRD